MVRYKYIICLHFRLLLPLVDLVQKRLEHFPLQYDAAGWRDWLRRDSLDKAHDSLVRSLLVLFILDADANLFVERLNAGLGLRVLAAIVGVEHGTLRGRRERKRSVDAPRALVVDNIRADLPEELRRHRVVEEVVLHLEVLAKRDEDALREGIRVVGFSVWDATHVHGERDGEVEGVVRGLVDDDLLVPARERERGEREPAHPDECVRTFRGRTC